MRLTFRFALGALATILLVAPAAADTPTLLGVFKDWQAFTSGSGSAKICYAISKPTATEPKKVKRDPIYFLITDWPGRHAKAEPEVVPGYQYKEGSTVTGQIGTASFEFFTKNDGTNGAAWVRERVDEVKLVDAMRAGQNIVVIGTSKRGTHTTDTYSLAGISDALDKIHATCGM